MSRWHLIVIWVLMTGFAEMRAQEPGPTVGVVDPLKGGMLPGDTNALARKAAAAFSKRDWKAAREAYEEMLKVEPVNALAWANLGAVEKQAGNLNASVECFEQSVRFNPSLVQSWISLGLTYSDRGDMYKALSSLAV